MKKYLCLTSSKALVHRTARFHECLTDPKALVRKTALLQEMPLGNKEARYIGLLGFGGRGQI